MPKAYLCLGSNIEPRIYYLDEAERLIKNNVGDVIKSSAMYESEPWGFTASCWFLNKVIVINTAYNPYNLLKKLLAIEKKLDRKRIANEYISRTIDIDILFYENLVIDTENLIIPHPKIPERLFVLLPLQEIEPQLKHPLLNTDIKHLHDICPDRLVVRKFKK